MKRKKNKLWKVFPLVIASLLSFLVLYACKEDKEFHDELGLIPEPLHVEKSDGFFAINDSTKIIATDNPDVRKSVNYLNARLQKAGGMKLAVENSDANAGKNKIYFEVISDNPDFGSEGYSLEINENGVKIKGEPAGLFYAVQTFLQLLPPEIFSDTLVKNGNWRAPYVRIFDKPRFRWRGMHLDVGRHFFPVDFIKRYIDELALHKFNTFHWHLTEDQGWRIEIKKYPRLTEIGAWREGTQIGKTWQIDSVRYGGFYTQDEIREVVKYAQDRFITIVPEIEMPGHCRAALASYPGLSCTGGPFEVATRWGVEPDIYCAGNDSVFTFLEDVLTEVMELFPSKYIHIGGDEAPKVRWENCSKCQARIKNEGLKDEHELQSYFIKRIEKFLNAHGRQIIGWDEILEGGLAPNAAVMSWRGISGGIAAAKQKHYVVMSPTSHCYFDYYQGPPELEPLAIGGYLPLGKVYEYEPVPSELGEGETKYILGVQGNVWTEYIATPQHVEYMAFPRACALAEVAWSFPERRDSISFFNRLQKHLNRLDAENINYRWLLPKGFRSMTVFIDRTEFYVEPAMRGVIKYTLDGSEPNRHSAVLSKPIEITENRTVKFKEFKTNGKSGKSYVAEFVKQKPLPALNKKPSEHGLRYELFALDEIIDSMKQIQNLPLLAKGVMEKFDLPDGEGVPYRFAAKYYGLLKIPETAVYEFGTISDDGTKLYIDGVEIVNNDGQHGRIDKSSQIALEKGTHEIYLEYFQVGGGKFLQVYSVKKGVKKELSEDELFLE